MDVFTRTFRPAAAEAGVDMPDVSRHMAIFRTCIDPDDATVLVTRCVRPDAPAAGEFLLLLTYHRLVVTKETRVLHRMRVHLNADLRHLSNVSWSPDPRDSAVEVAATAVDGVRERFKMRFTQPDRLWRFDALLKQVFVDRKRSISLVS
ncbi:MAG: hypothetical protein ABW000_19280 [Actinoplanes sp.]